MKAVLCILGEIWSIAAVIHFILPVGWNTEWYGIPLFLTFAAIVIATGNYIDRSFKKLKESVE